MSRSDMQSREAITPSRFSQLIQSGHAATTRVEPTDRINTSRMSREELAHLAEQARAEADRQKIRKERDLLDTADRLASTPITGRETPGELQHREELLTRAQLLRVQTPTRSERGMEPSKAAAQAPQRSPEETEWAGEQAVSDESIPEQTLPVMEIGEGLQAQSIEGFDKRSLKVRFDRHIKPGDFLEYTYAGALRLRLKVVNRVGNLPEDALYATSLHESPEANEFADEVMRLQRSIQSKAAKFARREKPRVWQMNVLSGGDVSVATLRDPSEVMEEATMLQKQVEEHNSNTQVLVGQFFAKVPAASEETG